MNLVTNSQRPRTQQAMRVASGWLNVRYVGQMASHGAYNRIRQEGHSNPVEGKTMTASNYNKNELAVVVPSKLDSWTNSSRSVAANLPDIKACP
jgi:hypothetical protein